MPVIGQETVMKNIVRFGGGFLKHVDVVMDNVRKKMDARITKNMSLTDHSLADLRALGHPYARRHGTKGIQIHDPYWLVHTRSGSMMRAKESGTTPAEYSGPGGKVMATAYVRIDEFDCEHASFVIWGTTKMIPRPLLLGSLEQIKGDVYGTIKNNLRNAVIEMGKKQ